MKYRLFIEGKPTNVAGEYSFEKLPWAEREHIAGGNLTQAQRARRVFLFAWIISPSKDLTLYELVEEGGRL